MKNYYTKTMEEKIKILSLLSLFFIVSFSIISVTPCDIFVENAYADNDNENDDDGNDNNNGNDGNDSNSITENENEGTHYPGWACLDCHKNGTAASEERFGIGGTVYTASNGVTPVQGATVTVRSSAGQTYSMTTDSKGNFYSKTIPSGTLTISIAKGTASASMVTQQSNGNCNTSSCHASGSSIGRVFLSSGTNTTTVTNTTTTTTNVTSTGTTSLGYNPDIKAILDAKCILCHTAGGARSQSPLTTYAEAAQYATGGANSLLVTRTQSGGLMSAYLTTAEAASIRSWIVDNNVAQNTTTSTTVSSGTGRVNGTIDTDILTLSWDAVAGAASYGMYAGLTSGSYGATRISLGSGTSKAIDLSNVPAGTYYLKLVSISSGGVETAGFAEKTITRTGVPTGFTASLNGTTATFSWTGVSGASGYLLNYGLSSGFWLGTVNAGTATSFTINTSNIPRGTYYLAISAYNSDGTTAKSSVQTLLVQ
ncbi:MAG: hypothetical protein HQK84_09170 [Nitrospinae bacterium]|nr:hypothetical protein [Nitrospinota bacterium]